MLEDKFFNSFFGVYRFHNSKDSIDAILIDAIESINYCSRSRKNRQLIYWTFMNHMVPKFISSNLVK